MKSDNAAHILAVKNLKAHDAAGALTDAVVRASALRLENDARNRDADQLFINDAARNRDADQLYEKDELKLISVRNDFTVDGPEGDYARIDVSILGRTEQQMPRRARSGRMDYIYNVLILKSNVFIRDIGNIEIETEMVVEGQGIYTIGGFEFKADTKREPEIDRMMIDLKGGGVKRMRRKSSKRRKSKKRKSKRKSKKKKSKKKKSKKR